MSHEEVRLVLELMYEEHLHTVEPSMNTINKFKQREHTQTNKPGMILISEEPRTGIINRLKTQGILATHILEQRTDIISRLETQQGTAATH